MQSTVVAVDGLAIQPPLVLFPATSAVTGVPPVVTIEASSGRKLVSANAGATETAQANSAALNHLLIVVASFRR
jgi:hypothetical protein